AIDELAYQSSRHTLWSWPGQSPYRYADPSGRYAVPGLAPFLTAPLAPGGAVSFEVGIATASSAGTFGAFALAAGAIITAATYDILTQLDQLEHPTVTTDGGSSPAGSGRGCPSAAGGGNISGGGPPAPPTSSSGGGGASDAGSDGGDPFAILRSLPRGRQSHVRTVGSEQQLEAIFDQLASGGTPVQNYPGRAVRLSDGTFVGIRQGSASGGPTIDINRAGIRTKIHIEPWPPNP
ncbi:MAG: hypothetical protein KC657_37890, partial [Myxococcales bacterium]|nr:hypothetical protein [Myxococcales bacterium]